MSKLIIKKKEKERLKKRKEEQAAIILRLKNLKKEEQKKLKAEEAYRAERSRKLQEMVRKANGKVNWVLPFPIGWRAPKISDKHKLKLQDYRLNKTEARKPNIANLTLGRKARRKKNVNVYMYSYILSRFLKRNALTLEHTTVYPYWDFRLAHKFDYNFFSYRWSQGIDVTHKYRKIFSFKYIKTLFKFLSSQKLLAKNNWFNKYYKSLPVYLP